MRNLGDKLDNVTSNLGGTKLSRKTTAITVLLSVLLQSCYDLRETKAKEYRSKYPQLNGLIFTTKNYINNGSHTIKIPPDRLGHSLLNQNYSTNDFNQIAKSAGLDIGVDYTNKDKGKVRITNNKNGTTTLLLISEEGFVFVDGDKDFADKAIKIICKSQINNIVVE